MLNRILLCIVFCQVIIHSDLFESVSVGNAKEVEILIDKGAKVNIKDAHLQTPLIYALNNENKEIAAILIANGADVNICDRWGYSALILACWSKDAVKLLVENGADINFESNKYTALSYAASVGHPEIVQFFINRGVDLHTKKHSRALIYAVQEGYKEVVQILCYNDIDINIKNRLGYTPLISAIERERYDIALYLLDKTSEINRRYTPATQGYVGMNFIYETQDTPLIATAKNLTCSYSLMQGLIDAGANINAQNSFKNTALTIVVDKNNKRAVDLLISGEANLDLQDRDGNTALMLAVYNNNYTISKKLVKAGANLNIKNNNRETALNIATKKEFSNIVRLLLQAK